MPVRSIKNEVWPPCPSVIIKCVTWASVPQKDVWHVSVSHNKGGVVTVPVGHFKGECVLCSYTK